MIGDGRAAGVGWERAWWSLSSVCSFGPAGPIGGFVYRTRAEAAEALRRFARGRGLSTSLAALRSGPRHSARPWGRGPLPEFGRVRRR